MCAVSCVCGGHACCIAFCVLSFVWQNLDSLARELSCSQDYCSLASEVALPAASLEDLVAKTEQHTQCSIRLTEPQDARALFYIIYRVCVQTAAASLQ